MPKGPGLLLAGLAIAASGCARPPSDVVTRVEAACTLATARVTAARGLPLGHVASCDPVGAEDSPAGYHVLGLRAVCDQDLCGSTLMRWFAVETATGTVFECDMAEWRLGPEVTGAE
ncbi:hypothetical protein [Brevundimonas sp. A19_0]|uniref:hypothetical protein n=1 Tax=Brevundimonas sp. A19_0 TaxID=2821087 RepID=UPI001ADA361C|nr:hypothetical protein [Brevundimonas sp. A19_0]MBO9502843.1 hypothetical protein [Brevundimonas sp. A19_0]